MWSQNPLHTLTRQPQRAVGSADSNRATSSAGSAALARQADAAEGGGCGEGLHVDWSAADRVPPPDARLSGMISHPHPVQLSASLPVACAPSERFSRAYGRLGYVSRAAAAHRAPSRRRLAAACARVQVGGCWACPPTPPPDDLAPS